MKTDGQNSGYMKSSNRALVLELLATGRTDTRIGLSQLTGLSKMAVTNIINDFIDAGLIVSGIEQEHGRAGRKPQTLAFCDDSPLVAGIYISRNGIYGLLCDLQLHVVARRDCPLADETRESFARKLTELCAALLGDTKRPVWSIGVASIGPLDSANGILLNPRNFFDICDFNLHSLLSGPFNLPVFVENDMDAAALAELYYGAGRNYENFLYIGLTNGVGSGIVNNRQLYHTEHGLSGELGHTGIDMNGALCSCGRRGCLELYVSIPVLEETISKRTGQRETFQTCCSINTPEVSDALETAVDTLSYALLNQVNMLNPQAIVFGHESAYLPQSMLGRLSDTLNRHKLWEKHGHVSVDVSHYGAMSPVFGAVCAALSRWFAGDLPAPLLYGDSK